MKNMTEMISSSSNPLIKIARFLRQKKGRDETGLFLVEGILHVGEAVEAGWEIDSILYCPARLKSDYGLNLVDKCIGKGIRCVSIGESAFDSLTEKENPQGIVALVRKRYNSLRDISPMAFAVAVASPQDPGNVGTILRTMDAVGADGLILLDGGVEPYHPSVIRASMGAIFWKPFYSATFQEFLLWAQSGNVRIIGTSAHSSVDFRKVTLDNRPTIMLLGPEQKGLQPDQLAVCNDLISIKMRGRATSLNLAVAAGILLYALKG